MKFIGKFAPKYSKTMQLPEISIEQFLKNSSPEAVHVANDVVMFTNINRFHLFDTAVRLNAAVFFVCRTGTIRYSINLKEYTITEHSMMVIFAGDILKIHSTDNLNGFALILSNSYLQSLQLNFSLRSEYINYRGNGPVQIPADIAGDLQAYQTLLYKNIVAEKAEIVRGLTQALSHTILDVIRLTHSQIIQSTRQNQLFDIFMSLLTKYHTAERSLQFYADKMCLSPKYLSKMVKRYSGKSAMQWINQYVMLEIKMMLNYTPMSIQEITYRLNFSTQSAFGKYFKQQTGLSPKQYRNQSH